MRKTQKLRAKVLMKESVTFDFYKQSIESQQVIYQSPYVRIPKVSEEERGRKEDQ